MPAKTVLIVENEESLIDLMKTYFVKSGFLVHSATRGTAALELFSKTQIDLVVLDIMLDDMDGWSVLRTIRTTSSIPVLMLTARSQETDKLFGFELGADDYMTKPFSLKELLARSKALLRRVVPNQTSEVITLGRLTIDSVAHQAMLDGAPFELTPKEFDLLLYMVNHQTEAVSREQLLQTVWGYDYFGDLRTVDTHIRRLRQKLKPYDPIETVFGIGYRFKADAL
ncbi:MAG: response regulator transcription factor [Acholeplasmataceae bacterium]|nr:response regulator transcription factor [Acholeplasmataceae bacterium]